MSSTIRSGIWQPTVGEIVRYVSRHSLLARNGRAVRVLAEASRGHMRVAILGHAGAPVEITVKAENLRPLPPSLFSTDNDQ